MKISSRFIKDTLPACLLAIFGASLLVNNLVLAAQGVEPTMQLPKKTLQLKRDTKSMPAPVSGDKKVNSSGGGVGMIGDIIDGPGGGGGGIGGGLGINMNTVDISALSSISPLGFSTTATPDTTLPLSAWKKVECNITTEYFPTVTGNQPNNDVIKTAPTLSISGNAVSFVCPYKTSAHALNIAKSVAVWTDVSISYVKNGMTYSYSGALIQSCTRATKTTALFTCGI